MMASINSWQPQTLEFGRELLGAMQQQHHAAQFLALVGRHLIPRKDDDSNTNMRYLVDEKLMVGNPLPNKMFVALHLPELILYLLESNSILQNEVHLVGKTKVQVFEKLQQVLADSGIDISDFKNELHYQIPAHALDEGSVFTMGDLKIFQENIILRANAEIVINEMAGRYGIAEPVRIWPHHFDTGTFLPVAHNEKRGVSKSMGLGWAIPDDMVGEPYYYLSYWSEKSDLDFSGLPSPDAGEWISSGWNGGILRHAEILTSSSPEKQYEMVKSFFNSGIRILKVDLKQSSNT